MKKQLLLLGTIVLSIFFCCFPRTYLNSCGYGNPPDYSRFSLFEPDLVEREALLPFTYCADVYFKKLGYDDENQINETDIYKHVTYDTNVSEWSAYLNGKATAQDIKKLLYDTEPKAFFDNKKDSLSLNGFYALAKQNKPLMDYLTFAKQAEVQTNAPAWSEYEDEAKETPKPDQSPLLTLAETRAKECTDPFLKQRYAFLYLRLCNYFAPTRVANVYEAYFAKAKPSATWINGSAMYYYAKTKTSTAERNYWLSKAFDESIDRQAISVRSFERDSIGLSLQLAKTPHEKAVQYTMKALHYPGRNLPDLQQIYALDPTYKDLPMLIAREINKLENWLLTEEQSGEGYFQDEDKPYEKDGKRLWIAHKNEKIKADMAYLAQVRSFLSTVITGGKQAQAQVFLNLGAAHLAFLNKDLATAKNYLLALNKMSKLSARQQVQLAITSSMIACYEAPQLNAALKQSILKTNLVLEKNQEKLVDFATTKAQLQRFWATQLLKKGDVAESFLLMAKTSMDFNSTRYYLANQPYIFLVDNAIPKDYDRLLQIIETKKKADFEAYLCNPPIPYNNYHDYSNNSEYEVYENDDDKGQTVVSEKTIANYFDVNKIKDYKGSYYVRKDNLDSALAVYKTIPELFWSFEPYTYYIRNPFFVNIYVNRSNPADSTKYSKKSIVERMIALKKETETTPSKRAVNYYYLANAYYNMTYYGNSWLMTEVHKSSNDKPDPKRPNDPYWNCSHAIPYYEAALKYSDNKELSGISYFLLAHCKKLAGSKINSSSQNTAAYKDGKNIYANISSDCELYQEMSRRIY